MPRAYRNIFIPLLLLLLSGCAPRPEPEVALTAYVEAVLDGRCTDVVDGLSERTRQSIDFVRSNPGRRQNPIPIEEYYCRRLIFQDCKWKEIKLEQQTANTAKVAMPCGHAQDSFLPGFSSPFLKYEPRITELTLEDGNWRVILPDLIELAARREREKQWEEDARRRDEAIKRRLGLRPDARTRTASKTGGHDSAE